MSDNHGKISEDVLEAVSKNLVGADFVLRSPVLFERKGPRELADFLFLVDDTLIVVQSKSINISIEDLDDVAFKRIKKRYTTALKQLNTSLNAERLNERVEGTTSIGVKVTIDWSQIRKKIGIISLNLPDAVYDDPEFRFQYPELAVEHRGIQVHTFILRDLVSFVDEIKTAGDFFLYLETRWKCICSGQFIIGNELDFLAFSKCQYGEIESTLCSPQQKVWISPGYWEDYLEIRKEDREIRDGQLRDSILIDNLVRMLSESIKYSSRIAGISLEDSTKIYLKAIGMIGKMTLVDRSLFAKKMIEKANNTQSRDISYFAYCSPDSGIGYLYCASNNPDRTSRIVELENLGIHFCKQDLPFEELLCIGVNGLKIKEPSTDCIIMKPKDAALYSDSVAGLTIFKPMEEVITDEWSAHTQEDQ